MTISKNDLKNKLNVKAAYSATLNKKLMNYVEVDENNPYQILNANQKFKMVTTANFTKL